MEWLKQLECLPSNCEAPSSNPCATKKKKKVELLEVGLRHWSYHLSHSASPQTIFLFNLFLLGVGTVAKTMYIHM
jgi:hypothetical protein